MMNHTPLLLGIRERLIFALDVPSRTQALEWIDQLGDAISYKIGMELLASGEYFQVLDDLASRGKRVFVDLKFFDIPATVAGVIRSSFAVAHQLLHNPWLARAHDASGDRSQYQQHAFTGSHRADINDT